MNRDNLPERWCDDPQAPEDLRRIGEVLISLAEPAAPAARTRIWARLQQKTGHRHDHRWFAAIAMVATAVVGVVIIMPSNPEPRFAHVEGLIGGVWVFDEAGSHAPKVGAPIDPRSRILTGERGRVVITLDGIATTVLSESTEATIDTDGITLQSGTVAVAVAPRSTELPFQVAAGSHTVRVTGTLFVVTRSDGHFDVSVQEGSVEIIGEGISEGGKVAIKAGGSFSTRPPQRRTTQLQQPDFQAHNPQPPVVPVTETSAPSMTRAPDQPPVTGEPAASTGDPKSVPTPDTWATKNRRPVASHADERAIALFDDLSAADGIDAELTAYQAARLAKANDLDSAVDRYEKLLRRFPSGLFAREARLDLLECTMKRGRMDATWEHVATFLRQYPDSERVGEVRFIRGELLRLWKKDCHLALEDYQAAQSSPRRSEDALFFTAWCQLQNGDVDEAAISLRTYLQKYPRGRHVADARNRIDEISSE